MVPEPIRGVNKDQSRLKSLYFLLQATAKSLPLNNTERKLLNEAMPFLTIQSHDENWLISFSELRNSSIFVAKTKLNFYRHSDDLEIARSNKIEAINILITLFPELQVNSIILSNKVPKTFLLVSIAKKTIPNLLLIFLITSLNDYNLLRISALSIIPIILFRIEAVKVQILLAGNAFLITITFSESENLYLLICLIFLIIYNVTLELSFFVIKIKSYYWTIGQIIIVTSIVINRNIRLETILAILSIVLVTNLIFRRHLKVKSHLALLLFFGAIICLIAISILSQSWYSAVFRLVLIIPSLMLLSLRNRSTGLIPYLAAFTGLLTV